MSKAQPMLQLKNISAGYGTFQALFDVSLEVNAGEAVAVIGPNGAGKSTLLRVISKLIEARSGELIMEGKSYNAIASHEVISLGVAQVPEGRRLFPRLTVEDNLKMRPILAAIGDGLRTFPAHEGASSSARRHHVRR
jgi:branched-chain amino acid transport system ATP-binding protein